MIARTSQSRHIASAIPITPRLHQIPRSTDNTNRTPIVVKREIPMVNRTSPVARRPFPRRSANGKTTAFAILCIRTSQITRCLVCSEIAYPCRMNGVSAKDPRILPLTCNICTYKKIGHIYQCYLKEHVSPLQTLCSKIYYLYYNSETVSTYGIIR